MRGHALIDPEVVALLQPYIVTHWHGHRDSPMPAVVREELADRRLHDRRESNVFLLVLDRTGRRVHTFDGFPPRERNLIDYYLHELSTAGERLGLRGRPSTERPAVHLPGLPEGETRRGARVLVTFDEDRMRAYRAPVVEVAGLDDEVWQALVPGESSRTLDASLLAPVLSGIYPPGVMERTNPRTKHPYRIAKVAGSLTLRPAGSDDSLRYAILSGPIVLTDEGPDDFSFGGDLEIVVALSKTDGRVAWIRGSFDGRYPRADPHHDDVRSIRLTAAIESLPDE